MNKLIIGGVSLTVLATGTATTVCLKDNIFGKRTESEGANAKEVQESTQTRGNADAGGARDTSTELRQETVGTPTALNNQH